MKNIILVYIVFTLVFFITGCESILDIFPEAPEEIIKEADYFVSLYGDDNWSGTLSEPNSEQTDGPFKTINVAKQAVREDISDGMEKNIYVFIREGKYLLKSSLNLETQDSGRDGYQVIYQNYPGETPEIYGGVILEDWEIYERNIYRTSLQNIPSLDFSIITENDSLSFPARKPNDGYYRIANVINSNNEFEFNPNDFSEFNTTNTQVRYWRHHDWWDTTRDISKVDFNARRITLVGSGMDLKEGSRYYIQGAYEFLDKPGEFYVDINNNDLYYWPHNAPIENQKIIVPVVENLISLYASNIKLKGLHLSTAKENIISVRGNNNIISNSKISQAQKNGVSLHGNNNELKDSLIEQTGRHVVTLDHANDENKVINNIIRHGGYLRGDGSGVYIIRTSYNEVKNNLIYELPRYAVSMKTDEANNNLIKYNEITKVNTDSQDTGAIESWGGASNNVISYNLLYDFGAFEGLSFGIYLDDHVENFTVTHNIVHNKKHVESGMYDTGWHITAPIYIKGSGHEIKNNFFINNPVHTGMILEVEQNQDTTISNNIIYNSGNQLYDFRNTAGPDSFEEVDQNIFFNENNSYQIINHYHINDLSDWQDEGFDINSIIADPLFVDAEAGLFSFKTDSPAFDLGFEEIYVNKIGLKAGNSFK